ncbi:MAG: hypothetical protein N2167_06395 [Flavobacteriales bacterium]|nr:hypothetical protein [Flavobacteriales bacterium]
MTKKKNSVSKSILSEKNKPISSSPKIGFFEKNDRWLIYVHLLVAALVSFLLFDIKVTEAGDDSAYIQLTYKFLKYGTISNLQASGYSMFLAIFYLLFGLNIGLFKVVSILCVLGSIYFTYRAFKNKIEGYILHAVLFLTSVNYLIGYYASTTFSEPLFMLLQSLFLFYALQVYIPNISDTWKDIKRPMILAFMVFLLMLTRNIALVAPVSVMIFLGFKRNFIELAKFGVAFILLYLPYYFIRGALFKSAENQYGSQFSFIMMKNPYKPSLGNDDFGGFVQRFMDNANQFLSKHLLKQMGFLDPDSKLLYPVVAIFVILIGISSIYLAVRKKHDSISFIGFYVMCMLGGTFLAMQKIWDQDRFILIYYPLILIIIFWFFKEVSAIRPVLNFIKPLSYLLLIFIGGFSIQRTLTRIAENQNELPYSLKGDLTFGLTPDMKNFAAISKYAGEHVPDTAMILSRKPSISFIHGKREFHGLYAIPYVDEKEALQAGKMYQILELNAWAMHPDMNFKKPFYPHIRAVFMGGGNPPANPNFKINTYYLFFEFDPQDSLALSLKKAGLPVIDQVSEFVSSYQEKYFAIPSNHKKYLQENKIYYAITANLRMNPKRKTPQTINTVERYLSFVEMKYPGSMKLIHEVGSDEKAQLIQIDFSNFNY